MSLTKASLKNIKGGTHEFQFNPESYSLSKQSDWQANQKDHVYDLPVMKWKGGSAMKLEFTAFFDTYEADSDVRDKTRPLEELTLVDSEEHEPPKLTFNWDGPLKILGGTEVQWVLVSFNTTYKMFNASGVPVRAEMKLSLSEYATEQQLKDRSRLQSPDHEKAHRVQPGDTLQSIAFHHYEDPALWRPIAEANRIEDPRDLRPGAVLRVPRIR